jgi:hypothetical protein
MFNVRAEPLLLSEAGIHGLCVSLNTPVLNIDELPVGPARAALVLFDGGYGSLGLAVGVRSIETRQLVVFSYQGTLDMTTTPAKAMEDATSFAERMGFLFDEDVVETSGSDGRARALRLWTDLTDTPEIEEVEELDELAPPPLSPAVRLEPMPEELVLDDLADLTREFRSADDELLLDELSDGPLDPAAPAAEVAPELELPVATPPSPAPMAPSTPASPSGRRRVALSKFRQPAPPVPLAAAPDSDRQRDPGSSGSGSELGRIPLVRRRPDGSEEPARPGLLLRLLGSF